MSREGLDYIAFIRPGSAQEAALRVKLPETVKEEGTIDAIVKYATTQMNVPRSQEQVHGRLVAEIPNGYGAQIGETIYRHPDHARGDERKHLITHKVGNKWKKASVITELLDAKNQVLHCENMTPEVKATQVAAYDKKIEAIKAKGAVTDYMRLDMIVAEKLKGGYIL